MATLKFYDSEGQVREKARIRPEFWKGRISEFALHEAITAYQANRRLGAASTKTRGEVRGGGRKPWRQKGTGRARAGSIRSPIWVGGGRIFGPKPRNFRKALPRKLKRRATASAWAIRFRQGRVVAVDLPDLAEPRTRYVAAWLDRLGCGDEDVLVLTEAVRPHLLRAGRNISNLAIKRFIDVNGEDLLLADRVLIETELARNLVEGTEASAPPQVPSDEGDGEADAAAD